MRQNLNEQMIALKNEIKEKQQSIANENLFVIIALKSNPEPIMITYENSKCKKIIELKTIDENEKEITGCKFIKRTKIGECKEHIVQLKQFLSQFTLNDFIDNGLVIDFYKQHK